MVSNEKEAFMSYYEFPSYDFVILKINLNLGYALFSSWGSFFLIKKVELKLKVVYQSIYFST